MSNRGTKGDYRVGRILPDSTGGVGFVNGNFTEKVKEISFVNTSTCETDSTFDLPTIGIVKDVFIKITTASSAAGTMSVGLLSSESGGDARGFINAIGTSSTGLKWPNRPLAATSSGTAGLFLCAPTTPGTQVPYDGYNLDTNAARSVSYFTNSSATAIAGKIYIKYIEIA